MIPIERITHPLYHFQYLCPSPFSLTLFRSLSLSDFRFFLFSIEVEWWRNDLRQTVYGKAFDESKLVLQVSSQASRVSWPVFCKDVCCSDRIPWKAVDRSQIGARLMRGWRTQKNRFLLFLFLLLVDFSHCPLIKKYRHEWAWVAL